MTKLNIPNLKSYSEKDFKILSVKKCTNKFLFHSSGKKFKYLDPKYNSKKNAFGGVHEYSLPVVFATEKPSAAFCYTMTKKYSDTKKRVGNSAYHRLYYKDHNLLLGTKIGGYIHVLRGEDFYEIKRKDFENGKWETSTEWISDKKVKSIESIKVIKPFDWEMIPKYEFLGSQYVGLMKVQEYLKLAKDEKVKNIIVKTVSKPFIKTIPEKLKKYL